MKCKKCKHWVKWSEHKDLPMQSHWGNCVRLESADEMLIALVTSNDAVGPAEMFETFEEFGCELGEEGG